MFIPTPHKKKKNEKWMILQKVLLKCQRIIRRNLSKT
jgi:hypothetical protein